MKSLTIQNYLQKIVYSVMNDEHITDDYKYAQNIWKTFKLIMVLTYIFLYLKTLEKHVCNIISCKMKHTPNSDILKLEIWEKQGGTQ